MRDKQDQSGIGGSNMIKGRGGIARLRAHALASVAIAAAGWTAPAFAQDAPPPPPGMTAPSDVAAEPEGEAIVVTGSRTARAGFDAPTPVTVLDERALEARADTNIADAINLLPQLTGSVTQVSQPTAISGGALGVNLLNLRGLGPTRTLILQDGKRVIPTSFNTAAAAPDINHIPNGLVQRVDIVTGGASAVYGSDALAGVVNFVLDHDFTGLKGEATGGITTYGDNEAYNVSLTAGLAFGPEKRGHILLSGEVAGNAGVTGNRRPWNPAGGAVFVNPNYTATNGQPFYLVGDQIGSSNATPGGLITAGPLRGTLFGPGGTPTVFNFGLASSNNTMQGGDWRVSRLDDGYNIAARDRRHVLFGRASYQVADALNLYGEYQWSRSRDTTITNPYRRQGNLTIQADNAFIPPAIAARLTALGLSNFTMGTTTGDIGRVGVENIRELSRWAIGGDGKFNIGTTNWQWDAYYQQSRNGVYSSANNNVIVSRFLLAVDAVRNPATGAIVCRSTLTNPTNGCVPFNVMGIGVNQPGAINYVTGTAFRNDLLRQNVAAANLVGTPFETWAGPVSVAVGIEHRFEAVEGFASALDEANSFGAGNYHASFGSYKVTEEYLEATVPLARDLSFADSLELNGAVRHTNYSTSGSVTTWKVGGIYAPVPDIRFRVTRSRDIRAPNLGELFSAGQSASGANIIDPFTGNSTVSTFIALRRGNPTLQPEVADTLGLGVVLAPSMIPGLQASIDYYKIDIDNAVKIPNEQTVVNLCFAGNEQACGFITRNSAGVISIIATPPANVLSQDAEGIDMEIGYRLPLSTINGGLAGAVTLRALGNYVISLKNVDTIAESQGAGVQGDFGGIIASGPFAPKFRSTVTLGYEDERLSTSIAWHYISPSKLNNLLTECTSGCPTGNRTISENDIDSNSTFDYSISYKPFRDNDSAVFFAVDNVLNQAPPFVPGRVDIGFYTGQYGLFYDRIGRTFRGGIRFKM